MTRAVRWTLAVSALLAALLLGLTLRRVAERGRFARAFSSYGSGPTGVRALYLVLGELGFAPRRWSQDLARLPARGTLVALGDCDTHPARRLSRYEREELLSWVDRGGLLLVAGARYYLPAGLAVAFEFDASCAAPNSDDDAVIADDAPESPAPDAGVAPPSAAAASPLERDAGVRQPDAAVAQLDAGVGDEADDSEDEPDPEVWAVPMAPALQGLPIVRFRSPGRFKLQEQADAETLLGAPEADTASSTGGLRPLAIALRHGQGHVIVLASANMLQNAELEASAGATLLRRLLESYGAGGPVLFDEYHLGVGERRSLMQYLRQLGGMPALCQLLGCVLILLWRAGARFGGLQAPELAAPAGTISFVTALGGLYQGVGDASAAVRLIARAALARIATHHGLTALRADALERALAERNAQAAQQAVRTIVAVVSSMRSEPLPSVVQRIDAAEAGALADAQPKTETRAHARGDGMLPPRRT